MGHARSGANTGAGLGIDVGGTTAKLGIADGTGQILWRATVPTGYELPADGLIDRLVEAARPLLERAREAGLEIGTAGLALPGMLLPDLSGIRNVTNMPGLNNAPLRSRLAERLGLAVALDNDACAAALGEFRYGAGQGAARLLVVTVGTGIGAGMVVDGVVFRTSQGCLGDPGHVIVAPDGPQCGCGGRGCMEVMAAAPAIARRAAEAAKAVPESALTRLTPSIEVRDVAQLAGNGDTAAQRVLAESARWLGMGLTSLLHVLSPERILIGGGVAEAGDLLLDPLRAAVLDYGMPFLTRDLTLARAALTTDAGLLGAAAVGLHG
jgi:glucokinase